MANRVFVVDLDGNVEPLDGPEHAALGMGDDDIKFQSGRTRLATDERLILVAGGISERNLEGGCTFGVEEISEANQREPNRGLDVDGDLASRHRLLARATRGRWDGCFLRRAAAVALLASLVAAGCGSGAKVATTTNAQGKTTLACAGKVHFAKTKFVLHAGLAFGAFHRYILKPYRAGALQKGAPGRTKALVKAGAAALFAYHELKVARTDAVCDGPRLRRLAGSISGALSALNSLRALKTGTGLGAIGLAGKALDRLGGEARSSGAEIKDRSP